MKKKVSVCVLMSTYNGSKYIREQIDSILNQEEIDISIFVRDDGSKDGTQDILDEYKGVTRKKLFWYQGENLGPAKSFFELMLKAPCADYYAFADQDDVWDNDKLISAVYMIDEKVGSKNNQACFYYSNVRVVNEKLNILNISDIKVEFSNLKHILFHNSAIGCTVVFNKELLDIIKRYTPNYIKMHDWWVYQVCLALGGKIVFDENPHISYRQHQNNCIGFKSKKKSMKKVLLEQSECNSSKMAAELFNGYQKEMQIENRKIIETVAFYKTDAQKKWELLTDNSFYRETGKQRMIEKIAVIRNRK